MLTRVTITGADDLVDPKILRELSDEFPFVEWGILRSVSREGEPRYPSADWREKLEAVAMRTDKPGELDTRLDMRLSAHFCGQLVRDTLAGDEKWFKSLPAEYDRVQLNGFHFTREVEELIGRFDVEWIIQAKTAEMLHEVENIRIEMSSNPNITALWDVSGGQGIEPAVWPSSPGILSLGYAGGITPENVAQVIQNIMTVTEKPFWIDLESGVRTDDKFDLVKVRSLLERAKPFLADPGS